MKDNYKVKINPPELSSEQIKQHQNFDALLASFEQKPTAIKESTTPSSNGKIVSMTLQKRRRLKYIASAIITLTAASLLFTILRQPLEEIQNNQPPTLQINEILALQSPLPNLAKPVETQKIQAEKGETLTYASGSKVIIPASAFVNKEGMPIKGEVEITYREFNDPVDMFLAGIPKELNKHQDLQSTGMMEIKGFQNGEPVYLDLEKKLSIELKGKMTTDMKPDDLGVYVYSQQKDAWTYTGKDQVEILSDHATSNEETNTLDSATILNPIIVQLQKERQNSKPTPPIRPGVPSGMQVFDFDIDLNNAPELKQYHQKIEFMAATEDLPPATFDTVWNDMTLTKNVEDDYKLTLKLEGEAGLITRTFDVKPVVVATEESMTQYQVEKKRYEKALNIWKENIIDLAKAQITATKTIVNIINNFDIQRFGLWNCGKPIQWEQNTTVPTQFVDLEGTPIVLQEVFVAAQQQQFYYSAPSNNNNAQVPLPYDSHLKQKIWAMSAEGELLVVEIAESPTTAVLPMRPVVVPASAEGLRELLTL